MSGRIARIRNFDVTMVDVTVRQSETECHSVNERVIFHASRRQYECNKLVYLIYVFP